MIENIVRHMEKGESPMEAASKGAREIGFTVISLTLSLIAVFIPLLFMTGLVGRMFREFALTLHHRRRGTSAIVSLTLTPMMCSRHAETLSSDHEPTTVGFRGFKSVGRHDRPQRSRRYRRSLAVGRSTANALTLFSHRSSPLL